MQGMLGIRDGVLKRSGKTNPSARDFINFSGRGQTDSAVVGGPKEIADYMEEMFANRGCDGFVVAATHVPGAYADFVRHVIPELQRRGLYHKDYTGKTLRENLGLPRPPVGAWKVRRRQRRNSGIPLDCAALPSRRTLASTLKAATLPLRPQEGSSLASVTRAYLSGPCPQQKSILMLSLAWTMSASCETCLGKSKEGLCVASSRFTCRYSRPSTQLDPQPIPCPEQGTRGMR